MRGDDDMAARPVHKQLSPIHSEVLYESDAALGMPSNHRPFEPASNNIKAVNKLRVAGAVASMSSNSGAKPSAINSMVFASMVKPHQNAFSRLASTEPDIEREKLEIEQEEADTKHIGLPLPSKYANTTVTAAAG